MLHRACVRTGRYVSELNVALSDLARSTGIDIEQNLTISKSTVPQPCMFNVEFSGCHQSEHYEESMSTKLSEFIIPIVVMPCRCGEPRCVVQMVVGAFGMFQGSDLAAFSL